MVLPPKHPRKNKGERNLQAEASTTVSWILNCSTVVDGISVRIIADLERGDAEVNMGAWAMIGISTSIAWVLGMLLTYAYAACLYVVAKRLDYISSDGARDGKAPQQCAGSLLS